MSVERKSAHLRLRGLPFQSTEADIRQFLQDYQVSSVYICKKNSRPNGEAYVTFSDAAEAETAKAAKDKECLGNRYIEIFDVREDEKPPVKDDDDKNKGHVLRLRGLPYNATIEDIKTFFQGIQLSSDKNAIVISVSPADKKPQGEAYVDFGSDDAYREALKRNKQKIGDRYIELFPSSRGDLKQQLMAQQGGRAGDQAHHNSRGKARPVATPIALPPFPQAMPGVMPVTGPQAATDGSTVKLRGLPFTTSVDDIVHFFAGFGIKGENVQIVPKHDRSKNAPQCSGIAFVQFESAEAAKRAREEKDRKSMGARYVEVMPYTAPRHLQANVMQPQYGQPAGMPFPHALPPLPVGPPGHPGQRGMRPPPGAYGPHGGAPPHMPGYGGPHQPPPPPLQGGQIMPPGPVARAPGGGRGSQGNGRGRGGHHPNYQHPQSAPQHQQVDYSQQGYQQQPQGYYQQPAPHQQHNAQFQQQQQQWGSGRGDPQWAPPGGSTQGNTWLPGQQTGGKYYNNQGPPPPAPPHHLPGHPANMQFNPPGAPQPFCFQPFLMGGVVPSPHGVPMRPVPGVPRDGQAGPAGPASPPRKKGPAIPASSSAGMSQGSFHFSFAMPGGGGGIAPGNVAPFGQHTGGYASYGAQGGTGDHAGGPAPGDADHQPTN